MAFITLTPYFRLDYTALRRIVPSVQASSLDALSPSASSRNSAFSSAGRGISHFRNLRATATSIQDADSTVVACGSKRKKKKNKRRGCADQESLGSFVRSSGLKPAA